MADVSKLNQKENFWDVKGYKSVVKRTENGRKMCDFLLKLVEERATIEKSYSEKLNSWYRKWTHAVEKSPEYGTNKDMLKNFVNEADKLSDVHVKIKDSLVNLVNTKIKNWKEENYRWQVCGCKPASTFKQEFQKAQKPWAKQVQKVESLKKDYFKYSQESSNVLQQEENIQRTDNDYEKVRQKCVQATEAMDVVKSRYHEAVEELERLKSSYVTQMNNVFAAAQDFEMKRLDFFKDILTKLTEALHASRGGSSQEIYNTCKEYIVRSNPKVDTDWWAENRGPGMSLAPVAFEDILPEVLETISRGKNRLLQKEEEAAAIIPSVESPPECVVQAEIVDDRAPKGQANAVYSLPSHKREQVGLCQDEASEFDSESAIENHFGNGIPLDAPPQEDPGSGVYSTLNDSHIYSNEVQLEDGYVEPAKGQKVEAIYDYEAQSGNELSFGKGDVFDMLKERDDEGWATGRKDGKVGLFPSDYVRVR